MSKEESDKMSLREMLRQHMTESNNSITEIKQSLAKIDVHNEYTQEKLKTVDELKSAHNRQKGAMYVIGALGGTAFAHSVKQFFGL